MGEKLNILKSENDLKAFISISCQVRLKYLPALLDCAQMCLMICQSY